MNWLDKTITWISPQAGLRRARARLAVGQVHKLLYDGATLGRRTEGWQATGTSANAEIGTALVKLRDRSRDLVRNNPYASKAVSILVANAVGTGIIPQARTGSPALDQQINLLWERWCAECDADDQLDFYGLQTLIARSVVESGECLIRFRPRRARDGMESIKLQLQVIEPDYLDLGKTEALSGGGVIVQGVEFDAIGTRVAYWLFGQHPGESISTVRRDGYQSKRVPASEVLHIYRKDRPGQIRGVPWLAPIMLKLRDLDEYQEAELVRKKIEACFAAFVTQPEGQDGTLIGDPQATLDANRNRIESFEPGMIMYGNPGEEITFGSPSASTDQSYVRGTEHIVATGAGVMYEQLTGDLSLVNYSSYRAGHLEFRRMVDCYRWQVLIPMLCQPVWRRMVDVGFAAGQIAELNYGASWTPPRFESIDPEKDANADLAMIRSATKTLPQAIAEQGYDPDRQLQEIAETNKKLDALGLILDCDPRKMSKKGGTNETQGNERSSAA